MSKLQRSSTSIPGWWFWNIAFIFHFIYGLSSFPLTIIHIFQDGYCTTNQIPLIHLHNGWDPVSTSSMSLLTREAGPYDVAEVRWTLPGRGNPSVVFCCFKGFDMVQLENEMTVTQQNRIKLGFNLKDWDIMSQTFTVLWILWCYMQLPYAFFQCEISMLSMIPLEKTGKRSGFALWRQAVCAIKCDWSIYFVAISEENTNTYFVKISLTPTINYVARISYKLKKKTSFPKLQQGVPP